ncbi:MAG: hypothetical protein A2Y38_12140 [Spirochaetes bacterium GWB1_59_5]|nr:MAG: hypothetical protein A2Y38_12140 [Spirochaetes bacterium GWB1_59_5]
MTRWQIIKLLFSALFSRDMRRVLHSGGYPLGSPYEPPKPAAGNKDPMTFDPASRKWVRRKI